MSSRAMAWVGALALGLGIVACNNPTGADQYGMPGGNRTEGAQEDRTTGGAKPDQSYRPNNTGVNQRDQAGNTTTPMDQGESQADLSTTAAIRREILKADGLSSAADNVKVVTSNGQVTLRGAVKSEAERDQILAIAERVAGQGKVDNQLEVDTNQM